MSQPHEQKIVWFQTEECWMAQQSIAIVGKIWAAKDPKNGFFWTAMGWATEHRNGMRGNGYAKSLEDAKKCIEDICVAN
jgi:hypothetical protein